MHIHRNNSYQELNAILDGLGGGGGGGGTVTSANAPLSISGGAISVDLSAYASNVSVASLLAQYRLSSALFDGFSVGSGLVAIKNGPVLSVGLDHTEARVQLKLQDSITKLNTSTVRFQKQTLNSTVAQTIF